MWGIKYNKLPQSPSLSLTEERRLIAKAPKGYKAETDEIILRHGGFIIFRIQKKTLPPYVARFGEDILSQAVFVLYEKIKTCNLRYRDKNGEFKPVRFSSYIWKRIDGFILDSLKRELGREGRQVIPDWARYDPGLLAMCHKKIRKEKDGSLKLLSVQQYFIC